MNGALNHIGLFTQERHDVDGATVLGHELNNRIIGAHFQSKVTTSGQKSILQIEDRRSEAAMELLLNVSAKTYKRTDRETDKTRLGFIAQHFEGIPWAPNLTGKDPKDGICTLDYSRLVCVLWSSTQSLQKRIAALEAREAKGSRKKPAA